MSEECECRNGYILEFLKQAARIENSMRVEIMFDALLNGKQCGRQGVKNSAAFIAAAKQRGLTVCGSSSVSNRARRCVAMQPAQSTTPFDQL